MRFILLLILSLCLNAQENLIFKPSLNIIKGNSLSVNRYSRPLYGFMNWGGPENWQFGDSIYTNFALANKLRFSDIGSDSAFTYFNVSRLIITTDGPFLANKVMPLLYGYSAIGSRENPFQDVFSRSSYADKLTLGNLAVEDVTQEKNGFTLTTPAGVPRGYLNPNGLISDGSGGIEQNTDWPYAWIPGGNRGSNPTFAAIGNNKTVGVLLRIADSFKEREHPTIFNLLNKFGFTASFFVNFNLLQPEYKDQYLDDGWVNSMNYLYLAAAAGHELGDHGPNDSHLFYKGPPTLTSSDWGVRKVINDTTWLEMVYDTVGYTLTTEKTTAVNVRGGNQFITQANGAFSGENYLWEMLFYNGDTLTISQFLNNEAFNPDTLILKNQWLQSPSYPNTDNPNYEIVDDLACFTTVNGLRRLFQASKYAAARAGLPIPTTYQQAGGRYSDVHPDSGALAARAEGYTLINVFRTEDQVGLGYNDTRQYPEYSRSSAFDIETQTADQMISAIANSVALRKLAVSSSHGYFLWPNTARSDTLEKVLQWCNDNQIPVLSARDWGVLLRKSTPDPFTNIFPALQNDLDGDDNPDGYILGAGVNYNTTGGVDESAGYRLSLSSPGEVFSVDYLASVEKGLNQLTIWTKGFSGSELTVDVDGAGYGAISSQAVDASVSNWTRHQIEFTVPYSVLGILIQIDLTSHTSGLVEVSGLELRKKP